MTSPLQQAPRLPLRLQPARTKWLLLSAVSVAGVAGGLYVLRSSPAAGLSAIVFFGLGALVMVANLLPGCAYLLLEDRGLTICSLFRKTFLRWKDVAEFLPVELGTMTMVGMRYTEGYKSNAAMRRLASQLSGAEGALPEAYGRQPEELVALLNELRRTHSREF